MSVLQSIVSYVYHLESGLLWSIRRERDSMRNKGHFPGQKVGKEKRVKEVESVFVECRESERPSLSRKELAAMKSRQWGMASFGH